MQHGGQQTDQSGKALIVAAFMLNFSIDYRQCIRMKEKFFLYPEPLQTYEKIWSGRWDSNPRPQPWQGCALPLSYARIGWLPFTADEHTAQEGKLKNLSFLSSSPLFALLCVLRWRVGVVFFTLLNRGRPFRQQEG